MSTEDFNYRSCFSPFREQAAPQNKKNAQISTVKMFMYTKIEKLQNKHFTNATTIGTI